MTIRYSEIFRSIQGEGKYTGRRTVWIRLWGCQLSCKGFYQDHPTKPETYTDPWAHIDFKAVTKLEDLPVLDKGCDSSYSHEKEFLKFSKVGTAEGIADELIELVKSPTNPDGWFIELTGTHLQDTHLCFTGGEPLMNQRNIVRILDELERKNNPPFSITFETNGCYAIGEELEGWLKNKEVLLSVSPKLYTVSGEKDAINYKNLKHWLSLNQTKKLAPEVQLKFVLTENEEAWQEMYEVLRTIKTSKYSIAPDVWIMPVGGTGDQQKTESTVRIVERAIAEGFNVSARVHNFIWNNSIGK